MVSKEKHTRTCRAHMQVGRTVESHLVIKEGAHEESNQLLGASRHGFKSRLSHGLAGDLG